MTDPRDVRIYTASKVKHAAVWRKLRDGGVPINSTWIDEAGEGDSSDLVDLASRCINEARSASAIVLYCEPGELLKGALFEAGAALAAGVPVFCVGTCDSLSKTFNRHPLWHTAESVEVAIAAALTPNPDAPPAVKDCPTAPPLTDGRLREVAERLRIEIQHHWQEWQDSDAYPNPMDVFLIEALSAARDRSQSDDSDRIETLEGALRRADDRLAAIHHVYEFVERGGNPMRFAFLLGGLRTLIEEGEKALREEAQ